MYHILSKTSKISSEGKASHIKTSSLFLNFFYIYYFWVALLIDFVHSIERGLPSFFFVFWMVEKQKLFFFKTTLFLSLCSLVSRHF